MQDDLAKFRRLSAGPTDVAVDPPAWRDEFLAQYPFALDTFQHEAIAVLATDGSVLVAAPTGVGKTVVAEYAIFRAHRRATRVIYTAPIKALSNQKYFDLRQRYGDAVGLVTGDVTENPSAPILVMTTEILRNMMMQTPWQLRDVSCVIFDEIHFLADPERGTTWEESIILCPDHIQLVCLSATVSNADEIAAWIGRTHRPVRLITHLERAVPLSLYYFLDGETHLVWDAAGRAAASFDTVGGEARAQPMARRGRRTSAPSTPNTGRAEPGVVEILQSLDQRQFLPAIFFLFSRRDCEAAADQATAARLPGWHGREVLDQTNALLAHHLAPLRPADRQLGQVLAITRLARRGLGFHHAGLLPPLKRLVEDLFTRGLMAVVFATDTLALGVNMPARTVVIGRMAKYDGVQRRLLLPNEFQQMAGRAGRRGLDSDGAVVVPYSPWVPFKEMLAIATGPLLPVESAFTIRYNTVLNLWDPPHGSRVRTLLHRSLHEFQTDSRVRELEADVLAIQAELTVAGVGCPVGHPASEEPLLAYEGLNRALVTARDLVRRQQRDAALLARELERRPWTAPSRETLRRAFRTMPPGTPIHHQTEGWGLFLSQQPAGRPLALFGERAVGLADHAAIDYLAPDAGAVPLPAALADLREAATDALAPLSAAERHDLTTAASQLDLPDLDAWRRECRERRATELAGAIQRATDGLAAAVATAARLAAERDAHVCHACPQRREQTRRIRQRAELERDFTRAEERLASQIRREQERVDRVVLAIARVLTHFGYLEHGQLSRKADMLANVYDANGLILCEAIDGGWFDHLAADDVAEVCSWFAFDRDTKFGNRFTLPSLLLDLRRDLETLQYDVFRQERRGDVAISTGYNRSFFGAARAWCRGSDLTDLAAQIELSEGDLVTTFNKTLDLMRQLREMLAASAPTHPIRATLATAIQLVGRDIVAQSYLLAPEPAVEAAAPEPLVAGQPTRPRPRRRPGGAATTP